MDNEWIMAHDRMGKMYRKLQMFNDWYPLLACLYTKHDNDNDNDDDNTTTTTTRQRNCVYKNMHKYTLHWISKNCVCVLHMDFIVCVFVCVSTKPTKRSKFVFLTTISTFSFHFQYFQYFFSIWNKASRSSLKCISKNVQNSSGICYFLQCSFRMYTHFTIFVVCNLQVFFDDVLKQFYTLT